MTSHILIVESSQYICVWIFHVFRLHAKIVKISLSQKFRLYCNGNLCYIKILDFDWVVLHMIDIKDVYLYYSDLVSCSDLIHLSVYIYSLKSYLDLWPLTLFSSQYPGLLSGCSINWMCDWPQESLLGEASYFITKNQLTEEFEDLRYVVIHSPLHHYNAEIRGAEPCLALSWPKKQPIMKHTVKVNNKKKVVCSIQLHI